MNRWNIQKFKVTNFDLEVTNLAFEIFHSFKDFDLFNKNYFIHVSEIIVSTIFLVWEKLYILG